MKTNKEWAGEFGDDYLERNKKGFEREKFWKFFLKRYPVKNALEVGCGDGKNIRHIPGAVGIDINKRSLDSIDGIEVYNKSIYEIDWYERFDLVFSCGVLIHQPPKKLPKAMKKMHDASTKYIMLMEYEWDVVEEIEYRGKKGLLWKAPFGKIFKEQFVVDLVEKGNLTKEQGFDNITYWLYAKHTNKSK